jgi:hypothetical protein
MRRLSALGAAAALALAMFHAGDACAQRAAPRAGSAAVIRGPATGGHAAATAAPGYRGGGMGIGIGRGYRDVGRAAVITGAAWRSAVWSRRWNGPAATVFVGAGFVGAVGEAAATDETCLFLTHHGWIYTCSAAPLQ